MFTNKTKPRPWARPSDYNPQETSSSRLGLISSNPKRRLMKLQQSDRIFRDNMHLLRKLRDVDYKSSKPRSRTFHLKSLNSKNRSDADYRIYNENLQIIGRLQSQKSRYKGDDIMRRSYQKKRTSTSKSKTEASILNDTYLAPQYEKIATASDGFENRLLLYTELLTLNRQLHHIEVSQNDSMYFIQLHNLTFDRCYKLRLVEATGEHLVGLIRDGKIRFSERIHKRSGMYTLSIPFYPFVRNYTFWVLQKKQKEDLLDQNINNTFAREDENRQQQQQQEQSREQDDDESQVLRRQLQYDNKHPETSKQNMYQTSIDHKHSRKSSSKSSDHNAERMYQEPTPSDSVSSQQAYQESFQPET